LGDAAIHAQQKKQTHVERLAALKENEKKKQARAKRLEKKNKAFSDKLKKAENALKKTKVPHHFCVKLLAHIRRVCRRVALSMRRRRRCASATVCSRRPTSC
jgi:hypothetical protein